MRLVFADTSYWVALLHRRDDLHERAVRLTATLADARVITTDGVLVEALNHYAAYGYQMRHAVAQMVRDLLTDPNLEVVPQERAFFLTGLDLYEQRPDKAYSAVDCMSMRLMRERGITEVLTHDRHFEQEGFVALLRG